MKTIRVRGVVGRETDDSQAWEVYVDLHLDDDGRTMGHEQLEFGAAPPPPTGDYRLIYFYRGEHHEVHGHIERRTWQQVVLAAV